MQPKRGDIFNVALGADDIRPFVIVQNNTGNKFAPTTIVIPVLHDADPEEDVVVIEEGKVSWEPRTIDKRRLRNKIGRLSLDQMKKIDVLGKRTFGFETSEFRWVKLPIGIGSEQGGTRPCLVITRGEKSIAVPVTNAANQKRPIPTHVVVDKDDFVDKGESIEKRSITLLEQPMEVDASALKQKIGQLKAETIQRINRAARISLGLEELKRNG